jgi:cobalt/nickel transport system permease protein
MTGITSASVGYALKKTGETIDERRIPVMGVIASFIFAAQMVNFPVAGGTSGHLIGAALATAIFGVWPAMIVMTAVLIMQCLLFQDGGIEALGANIFNMAIFSCAVSGIIIGIGRKIGGKAFYPATAIGAWCSVFGASVFCSIELGLSGTSPLTIVLPAMAVIHSIIGIFEGIITVVALRFIYAVNPAVKRLNAGMVS